MKPFFYLLIVSALFFSGCKKSSHDDPNSPDSLSFKIIEQKKSNDNVVAISWSTPFGAAASADITYKVSLNGVVLGTVKNNSYIFNDILATKTYTGEITAIVNGVEKKLDFKIEKENSFIFTHTLRDRFSCYTTTGYYVWSKHKLEASAVVISNDTLFVYSIDNSITGGTLYALNIKTGATFWSVPSRSERSIKQFFYNKGILYEIHTNAVFAINSTNGHEIWKSEFISESYNFAIDNDILVSANPNTSHNSTLISYDVKNGREIWRYSAGYESQLGNPYIKDGIVYIVHTYPTGDYFHPYTSSLCAFEGKTGVKKVVYNFPEKLGAYPVASRPLVIGNAVFFPVGSANGYEDKLYAVDKNTGALLWKIPMIYGGLGGNSDLFVYGTGGTDWLTKIDITTGKTLWDAALLGNAVITADKIYSLKASTWDEESHFIKTYSTSSGLIDATSDPNIKATNGLILLINNVPYY